MAPLASSLRLAVLTFLATYISTCTFAATLPQPQLQPRHAKQHPARVPITRRLPPKHKLAKAGGQRLVDLDRARVSALISAHQQNNNTPQPEVKVTDYSAEVAPESFAITNVAVTYVTSVGIGNPPTQYDLLIDTGSSNTWLGADKPYVRTNTSTSTINGFAVRYGSGWALGLQYNDQVTLSPSLVIRKQGIGVAAEARGFQGIDGILGVGPKSLTRGTLLPSFFSTVPTVTDNLFSQGSIPDNVLGIYFQPTTEPEAVNGELTFGAADMEKIVGKLSYVPVTSKSPASSYWGVEQTITYGSTQILKNSSGIVDTGTTLIYLATDAYNAYLSATGGVYDNTTGFVKIPPANASKLQSMFFNIGDYKFELTANAQIWPRALNEYVGGDADSTYSMVTDIGQVSGTGLDFINGYAFLERYYTVYDTTKQRIGFGRTPYTFANSN